MGIEKFFNSLKNTYGTDIINKFDKNLILDEEYLLIDFNSIIHNISSSISSSIKYLYHIFLISKKVNTIFIDNEKYISIHLKNLQTEDSFILNDINFNNLIIEIINESFFENVKKNLDRYIVHKIYNYVTQLVQYFPNLKLLYMAIDGVPLYAKMIEQRKRRYIGYIVDKAKQKILENYKKELNTPGEYYNQYDFEKFIQNFVFNKNKISPSTDFMIFLEQYLIKYLDVLKNKFDIILDSFNNPGEGEKKIVFKIHKLPPKSKIMTYSPDGDVILLMLLEINKKNIKIMRYDQQLQQLDIIDINKLKEIILVFMDNNEDYVIKDIVMLFTLLGNDFLPKIDIINTNKHITVILDCYKNIKSNIFGDIINWKLLQEFFILLKKKIINEKKNKFYRTKEWKLEVDQIINTNSINYRKQIFNIDYLTNSYNPDTFYNNKNKNKNKLINTNKITNKYICGFLWLYDYYIHHIIKYNYYYYNYEISPNIDDIINLLNNIDYEKLYLKLNKYIILEENYFTPKLQLKFITPKKLKINLFIKNNRVNIFEYLNCKNASYLSKCNIKKIKLKSGKKFLKKNSCIHCT